jgi:RNA polymerase sigma-70 factor (ECF subfamily)
VSRGALTLKVSERTARLFIEGNEAAIGLVYQSYKSLLYFIIVSIVKNNEDAQDVYQDVFAEVIRNRGNIKKPKDLHWYLVSSAKNKALNFVMKRDALVDYVSLMDLYSEDEKDNGFVQEVTAGLNDLEGIIFLYKYQYGFTFEEIARLTGLSRQTVAKYYKVGLGDIRKQYGGTSND